MNAAERLFDTVLNQLPDRPDKLADAWPGDLPLSGLDGRLVEVSVTSADGPLPSDRERLEPEEIAEIGDWIEALGFDVLAFYKSRRFLGQRPFPGEWGIFYFEDGLAYVSEEMSRLCPGATPSPRFPLDFLWSHEFCHYKCDLAALCWEEAFQRHLYIPVLRQYRSHPCDFVEEALANRDAYNFARGKGGSRIAQFAEDFFARQPGCYARYRKKKGRLQEEWLRAVVFLPSQGWPFRPNAFLGLPRNLQAHAATPPRHLNRRALCPEHIIADARLLPLLRHAYRPPDVKNIDETKKFRESLVGKPLEELWARTKSKLLENATLRGLNLKPWHKDGKDCYSVRLNDNFRAHLKHLGDGNWEAYACGSHRAMGHG
jgi:hypothetical protein